MGGRALVTIAIFSPYAINALATVRSSTNMLAILPTNGVSPSNSRRLYVKCLIFLSGINQI
jgi:hypothetical protein